MKGNERKSAFISFYLFFVIGTFQRVTADSNKKNFLPHGALGSSNTPPFLRQAQSQVASAARSEVSMQFAFLQQIAGFSDSGLAHQPPQSPASEDRDGDDEAPAAQLPKPPRLALLNLIAK
jgi:hypothetical protein